MGSTHRTPPERNDQRSSVFSDQLFLKAYYIPVCCLCKRHFRVTSSCNRGTVPCSRVTPPGMDLSVSWWCLLTGWLHQEWTYIFLGGDFLVRTSTKYSHYEVLVEHVSPGPPPRILFNKILVEWLTELPN